MQSFSVRLKSFRRGPYKSKFRGDETPLTNRWVVLITGAAGQLATHLIAMIVQHVRDQIRPDVKMDLEDFMNSDLDNKLLTRIKKKSGKSIEETEIEYRMPFYLHLYLVDVLSPDESLLNNRYTTYVDSSFEYDSLMKTALDKVITVFHLAAVGMTGKGASNRKSCVDINATGTSNLLNWSMKSGVQRFIYASSIGVIFDGKPLDNARESVVPYPDDFYNYYCETKSQAEKVILQASCSSFRTMVLRFNGIYGPGEKRVTDRVAKFMMSGLWIAYCHPGKVEPMTQLSSVANCVQGLFKTELALRRPSPYHGEVVNIMDKEPVGTFSFWKPLNRAMGGVDPYIPLPLCVMRGIAFVSEVLAYYTNTDALVTRLEVDLLCINNTFSIARAERDLGYVAEPPPMDEIVEQYSKKTILFSEFRKQRMYLIVCVLFSTAVSLLVGYGTIGRLFAAVISILSLSPMIFLN